MRQSPTDRVRPVASARSLAWESWVFWWRLHLPAAERWDRQAPRAHAFQLWWWGGGVCAGGFTWVHGRLAEGAATGFGLI